MGIIYNVTKDMKFFNGIFPTNLEEILDKIERTRGSTEKNLCRVQISASKPTRQELIDIEGDEMHELWLNYIGNIDGRIITRCSQKVSLPAALMKDTVKDYLKEQEEKIKNYGYKFTIYSDRYNSNVT